MGTLPESRKRKLDELGFGWPKKRKKRQLATGLTTLYEAPNVDNNSDQELDDDVAGGQADAWNVYAKPTMIRGKTRLDEQRHRIEEERAAVEKERKRMKEERMRLLEEREAFETERRDYLQLTKVRRRGEEGGEVAALGDGVEEGENSNKIHGGGQKEELSTLEQLLLRELRRVRKKYAQPYNSSDSHTIPRENHLSAIDGVGPSGEKHEPSSPSHTQRLEINEGEDTHPKCHNPNDTEDEAPDGEGATGAAEEEEEAFYVQRRNDTNFNCSSNNNSNSSRKVEGDKEDMAQHKDVYQQKELISEYIANWKQPADNNYQEPTQSDHTNICSMLATVVQKLDAMLASQKIIAQKLGIVVYDKEKGGKAMWAIKIMSNIYLALCESLARKNHCCRESSSPADEGIAYMKA